MNRTARILSAHGNHGIARHDDGQQRQVSFRRQVGRPLPGDRVQVDPDDAVREILPRKNVFGRGGPRGAFQPIAANLDTLLVVIAPEPAPSSDLLHRYLTAAWIQDVQPVIVINKIDRPIPDRHPFDLLDQLEVPVHRVRCRPPAELDNLAARLSGGIHLLAGQSGVGKSSLANVLVPGLELTTSDLSTETGKGTHTTSAARLHALPSGGWLVDTPGVWEYSLWKMPATELQRGFPEFAGLAARCRFRDCRHTDEPACAVRAAAESGELPDFRYRAWLRLLDEQTRLAGLG